MANISLKSSVVFVGIGLILGLAVCDGFLLFHSLQQRAIITGFADKQAAMMPSNGEQVPIIKGIGLKDGEEFKIWPDHSPPFALLVFREGCEYCEANWKNWDRLFGQGDFDRPVVMVTADKTISQPYIDRHPMLRSRFVITGVDPAFLASLRFDLTPETIYIVEGKVNHDWAGVLTSDDMSEIKKAVRSD